MLERIKQHILVFYVLLFTCCFIMTSAVWATSVSGIQLVTGKQEKSVQLESHIWQGESWIILKTAIYHLGGSTVWHGVAKKVVLEGPGGKKAVLTVNMPRMLLEERDLVRLPHLPRIRNGQLLITPESLAVIWSHIGDYQPLYDAPNKRFIVGKNQIESKSDKVPTTQIQKTSRPEPVSSSRKEKDITVVVDAGHGGKDPGAVGPTNLYEKTVTLEIARQLAEYLKQQGIKVIMTRNSDVYVSLKARTEIANKAKADLFVSIHANASRNRQAGGSQVFIYNREASSRHAAESAKRENQDANYLEIIKDDLRQSVHEVSSVNAAGFISQEFETLGLNVKSIERAPFYVLAKSHMPSILIETAFISNHKEEKQLRNKAFCESLAKGIYHGIKNYRKESGKSK